MNRLTIGLAISVAVLAGALLFALGRLTASPQSALGPMEPIATGTAVPYSVPIEPPAVTELEPAPPPRVESSAPASAPADAPFTVAEQRLIARDAELETLCRGGSGYERELACHERDTGASMDRLNAIGICWGREDEPYATYTYHRCRSGSLGYTP